MGKAIAMIETNSVAKGIEACDYMVKEAEVELLRSTTVCPGKYIVLVGGETVEVTAALKIGKEISGRDPRKDCVKENKRHPFRQESEQERNLIERMYYYGTDAEGNAESIRGQPEVQQHHRDHGRDERDVPGRIAAGDGKRAGRGAGIRKKSAHVGNGCRK